MNKGFSLVEVLLAVSILALIITGFTGAIIYGQQSTAIAGTQARATFIAEEGLEAVRNIRDASFSNLTNGIFGLTTTGNQWNISGSSDTTDIFTRQVTIADAASNRKQVTSTSTWQQNPQRTGTVTLVTYVTNWRAIAGVALPTTCAGFCQSLGIYLTGTCRTGVPQCIANGETVEQGGNPLCTQAEGGTCCCAP